MSFVDIQCPFLGGSFIRGSTVYHHYVLAFKFCIGKPISLVITRICCDLISVFVYRPKIRANECSHVTTSHVSCEELGAVMGLFLLFIRVVKWFSQKILSRHKEHE